MLPTIHEDEFVAFDVFIRNSEIPIMDYPEKYNSANANRSDRACNVASVIATFAIMIIIIMFIFSIDIYYALIGVFVIIVSLMILYVQQSMALRSIMRDSVIVRISNQQIV